MTFYTNLFKIFLCLSVLSGLQEYTRLGVKDIVGRESAEVFGTWKPYGVIVLRKLIEEPKSQSSPAAYQLRGP